MSIVRPSRLVTRAIFPLVSRAWFGLSKEESVKIPTRREKTSIRYEKIPANEITPGRKLYDHSGAAYTFVRLTYVPSGSMTRRGRHEVVYTASTGAELRLPVESPSTPIKVWKEG